MRARLLPLALLTACSVGGPGPDSEASDLDAGRDPGVDAYRFVPDGGFVACETASAFADPLPPTLLLQVDTSGSMNCGAAAGSCAVGDPTPDPSDSRYDVFLSVLSEALASLPDATRVGAMHYPVTFSCARDEALVEVGPLSSTRAPIATALRGVTPDGITPTHDAVAFALARLRARSADEPRHLVLATDGAATVCLHCDAACSFDALDRDNEELVERVRRAAEDDGVRTFVIGVPGSIGYRGVLSRMASAAGTARAGCSDAGPTYCHYDLTDRSLDFATALRAVLGEIGESVLSCEYTIPPNPDGAFDATKVNVRLVDDAGDTTTIPRDPSRANGWDYTDDGARILLHGPACERAQSLRMGRIDVLFGCPTELI
jgi:hypothetical protein